MLSSALNSDTGIIPRRQGMFSDQNMKFHYREEAVNVQIGTNGFDYEYPSDVHECGPSGPCLIQDALSQARGHYLTGADVLWIWTNYRARLEEMSNMHTWRSPDAAEFYSLLESKMIEQQNLPADGGESIAVPQ
jgi:hypothetical protein